ncbi:hypothetical protein [Listeria booriae]|uniref:Uncharacterized protein n=1 Tax=Listeria booriae TaxID=1552123 RepID=A0A7X0TKY5_9LIST|nr:hypothetical protein [Listeria booriae]MBC1331105.1 hypothetical protein [Listeria booriae]MBC2386415.1 hypothetical protein [Listeria booriae]
MKNIQSMQEVIRVEMTLEELIVITNALATVKPANFNLGIDSDKTYTASYCANPLLKNERRHLDIYMDMVRELKRRGVIKSSWAAMFD